MRKYSTILFSFVLLNSLCGQGFRKRVLYQAIDSIHWYTALTGTTVGKNNINYTGKIGFNSTAFIANAAYTSLCKQDENGEVENAIYWNPYNSAEIDGQSICVNENFVIVDQTAFSDPDISDTDTSFWSYHFISAFDTDLTFLWGKKQLGWNANTHVRDNTVMQNGKLYGSNYSVIDNSTLGLALYKIDLNTGTVLWNKSVNYNGSNAYGTLHSGLIGRQYFMAHINQNGLFVCKFDTLGNFIASKQYSAISYINAINGDGFKTFDNHIELFSNNKIIQIDTNLNVIKADSLTNSFMYVASRNANEKLFRKGRIVVSVDSNFNVRWSKQFPNVITSYWTEASDNFYYSNFMGSVGFRDLLKIDTLGNAICSYDTTIGFSVIPLSITSSNITPTVTDNEDFEEDIVSPHHLGIYVYDVDCNTDTLPDFSIFSTSTDTLCLLTDTLHLTSAYADSLVNHLWLVNGDTFHTQNVQYTFAQPGTFSITHITQIDGVIDTSYNTVFVHCCATPPTLSITSNRTHLCNNTAQLTAQGAFTYYIWNTDDTTQNILVSQAGTYACIASNACLSDTESFAIAYHCSAQDTTVNLILNNSFESFNSTSPDYYHGVYATTGDTITEAAIFDTSFARSAVNCWNTPNRNSWNLVIDSVIAGLDGNDFHTNPIHQQRELWVESYYTVWDSIWSPTIGIAHGVLGSVQTKLRTPLQAGQQYRLSGYVNSIPFIGDHDYVNDSIGGYWDFWKAPEKIGFYFTPNQLYIGNGYSSNFDTSYFFANTPTTSYTLLPFEHDFGNNAWQYFELTFTATSNDSFLSIAQSDTGVQRYPKVDSLLNLCSHDTVDCLVVYYRSRRTEFFLDNLTLIPISDTGKYVVNPYIPDPDSIFFDTHVLACNEASISLSSGANFWSYAWSTGDTTAQVNVTTDGTYFVTVSNGCGSYIDSVVVHFAVTDTSTLLLSASDTALCHDTITISVSDSFDFYTWNTGDTSRSISVSQIGSYTCVATKDCTTDTATISIVHRPCCGFFGSSIFDTICTGNSYLFNGENRTQNGVFYDTLQTAQGCDSIITLTLTISPPLQSNISQTVCSGNSYLFNGTELSQSGTYRDTLQNANGCDSIVTLTLNVNPPLQSNYLQTICAGNSVLFNGENYSASGTFSDTLQTANGCDSVTSLTLTVLPIAQNNITQTICEGDAFLFNGTPLSQSGIYVDTVQTSNACEVTSLTLNIAPLPESVSAENYFEIEVGDSVTLSACASGDNYAWFVNGEKRANNAVFSVSPKVPLQNYMCIISNETGCADTCVYTVKVNGIYGTIYVPNAFTPNGDGTNDVFQIFGKYIRIQHFVVFNRWGEKVYEVTNANPAWDGTFKGVAQSIGVYSYDLTYFSGVQNEAEHLKGSITLIR